MGSVRDLRRGRHNEEEARYETFAKAQSGGEAAVFCERQDYFTSSPTPLSSVSLINIWGSTLRNTRSPSLEPTTTKGKPMAINAMLEHS